MRYFEFDNHEYYALIAVKEGGAEKAIELYVEQVAGQSIGQVKQEGMPNEIKRWNALSKFIDSFAEIDPNKKMSEMIKEFSGHEDAPVLVCGTLA